MAELKPEGQDKPLCPHGGPCGPPGNGSRRPGLIFRESRYHILLLVPLSSLLPPSLLRSSSSQSKRLIREDSERVRLIFCYLHTLFANPPIPSV